MAHPTVFIGVGTTGGLIVSKIFERLNPIQELRASVQYRIILSENLDAKGTTNDPSVRITHLAQGFGIVSDLEDPLFNDLVPARKEAVAKWWPFSPPAKLAPMISNLDATTGAGGKRAIGRMLLHASMTSHGITENNLHRDITDCLHTFQADIVATGGQPNLHKVRVFLIGSLGGGTASGCILDLAYLLRSISIPPNGIGLGIYGMLLSGDCGYAASSAGTRLEQRNAARQNTLTTITELAFAQSNFGATHLHRELPKYIGDFPVPAFRAQAPFDLVTLVGAQNPKGRMLGGYNNCVDFVASYFAEMYRAPQSLEHFVARGIDGAFGAAVAFLNGLPASEQEWKTVSFDSISSFELAVPVEVLADQVGSNFVSNIIIRNFLSPTPTSPFREVGDNLKAGINGEAIQRTLTPGSEVISTLARSALTAEQEKEMMKAPESFFTGRLNSALDELNKLYSAESETGKLSLKTRGELIQRIERAFVDLLKGDSGPDFRALSYLCKSLAEHLSREITVLDRIRSSSNERLSNDLEAARNGYKSLAAPSRWGLFWSRTEPANAFTDQFSGIEALLVESAKVRAAALATNVLQALLSRVQVWGEAVTRVTSSNGGIGALNAKRNPSPKYSAAKNDPLALKIWVTSLVGAADDTEVAADIRDAASEFVVPSAEAKQLSTEFEQRCVAELFGGWRVKGVGFQDAFVGLVNELEHEVTELKSGARPSNVTIHALVEAYDTSLKDVLYKIIPQQLSSVSVFSQLIKTAKRHNIAPDSHWRNLLKELREASTPMLCHVSGGNGSVAGAMAFIRVNDKAFDDFAMALGVPRATVSAQLTNSFGGAANTMLGTDGPASTIMCFRKGGTGLQPLGVSLYAEPGASDATVGWRFLGQCLARANDAQPIELLEWTDRRFPTWLSAWDQHCRKHSADGNGIPRL